MAGGRVVLVSGASAGFGRDIVLTLARQGERVFAAIRQVRGKNRERAAEIEAVAAAEGLALEVVEIDVTDDESVKRGVDQVLARAGRIDALVNNAGFGVLGPWEMVTIEQAKRQFDTNLFGVLRLCQAVVPNMRTRGDGIVINVSSDAGFGVLFLESLYASSKFALEGLTAGMRWELQQFGVRVCLLNPGWYATSFGQGATFTEDGPYQALAEHYKAAHGQVSHPSPHLHEITERVVELLDMPDPPLHTLVGCSEVCLNNVPDAEFERRLFATYGMEGFRGPWTRSAQPTGS